MHDARRPGCRAGELQGVTTRTSFRVRAGQGLRTEVLVEACGAAHTGADRAEHPGRGRLRARALKQGSFENYNQGPGVWMWSRRVQQARASWGSLPSRLAMVGSLG